MTTLPSSPPLLPLSSFGDVPSSPLRPATASSSRLPWISARKRPLAEDDSAFSSDPLFSDDTSGNEDAAGYQRPKRKRMIKGPWWELGRKTTTTTTPKQKDYARNVDSGVWMGSDGSDGSSESLAVYEDRALRSNDRLQSVQPPRAALQRPTPQAVAADIVNRCVEEGVQRVDLSQLGLNELPSSILKPLHELIRQPMFDATLPPSDDELGPLTPDLQLFLATNGLTALPDELFRLENLTVLSLRNNALTELPAAISALGRLQELNVANNAIQYLPWELLDILAAHHTRVILRPNPLMEPLSEFVEGLPLPLTQPRQGEFPQQHVDPRARIDDLRQRCAADGTLDAHTELELRLQLGHALYRQHVDVQPDRGREVLIYLASSSVQFYDIDGRQSQSFPAVDNFSARTAQEDCPDECMLARGPSLLELSLESVRQHFDLSQIPDSLPPRVQLMLRTARTLLHDQRCSSCHRRYIVPRAQWIEYWHGGSSKVELTHESVLPFVRRACSWACAVPTAVGVFRA